jgi:hypothetical protein
VKNAVAVCYLYIMVPDYPHKLFSDHRNRYWLLVEALAMEVNR